MSWKKAWVGVLPLAAAAFGAELKIPPVPFPETAVTADMKKAVPVMDRTGVRIGDKFLRIGSGYAFTQFFHKGNLLFQMNGRIAPAPKWAPFQQFTTRFQESEKILRNECPFEIKGGGKGVFRQTVKLTPDGKIAMTFQYDSGNTPLTEEVLGIEIPTAFLRGKTIRFNDREPIPLPESAEEYVNAVLPKSGGGIGGKGHVFPKPKRLEFACGNAAQSFAFEFSPEITLLVIHKGRNTTQIALNKKKGVPFTIVLDPGSGFMTEKKGNSVGGVDFMQENNFHVAAFDQKRNYFINPSLESGFRYFKTAVGVDCTNVLYDKEAHSGKFSLRPTGTFYSVGVVLKPDTEYTLSVWIKSLDDHPATIGVHPRGIHGYSSFLNRFSFTTRPPHRQWQRVSGTFRTKPSMHEVTLWFEKHGKNNLLMDDFQLEEGGIAGEYAGNRMGLEILSDSPENPMADAGRKSKVRLAVRGPVGQTGTLEIRVSDFFDRKLFSGTVPFKIGEKGEQEIPFSDPSLFLNGIHLFCVTVRPDGLPEYTDYLRFYQFPYADNTKKHKNLQSTSIYGGTKPFLGSPEYELQLLRNSGIGALSYLGDTARKGERMTKEEYERIAKYGLSDLWGGVIWSKNWKNEINGKPWSWNGKTIEALEAYPPKLLKWMEEMAYQQTKANPYTTFWSLPTEPRGRYRTLVLGKNKEYAKLILAINRGIMRANPDAVFNPYGAWNMFQQGRNDVISILKACRELEPETRFKVIDIHTYRSFPESPDVEEDLLAFLKALAEIGYPDIKIKIGEGSYYYPMIRNLLNVNPWSGVAQKDGYSRIVIPSYDLGWGERIGAAMVLRETLVYYKHADRVIANCSWCPVSIDNRHPVAWTLANAVLVDLLGNADFRKDIRFAPGARAYLFEDEKKHPVAAIWNFDERFDRGIAGGTSMTLDLRGRTAEWFDMMGNSCSVPRKDGKDRIPLSGFPVFIRMKAGETELLAGAIENAEIASAARLPLQFSATFRNAAEADVQITNPLTRTVKAEILTDREWKPIQLGPKGSLKVPFRLKTAIPTERFAMIKLPIRVRYQGKTFDETFETAAIAVRHVKDGFDWKDIPSVKVPYLHVMKAGHKWKGESDLSASCRLAWNEKNLYLRFEVTDDRFLLPDSRTPWGQRWNYDNIQLFFDSFGDGRINFSRGVQGFDTNDFSYELLPVSKEKAVVYRRLAPDHQLTGGAGCGFVADRIESGVTCRFKAEGNKQIYDAVFPVRYLMPIQLSAGGTAPGFAFEIYDRDVPDQGAPQKVSNVPLPYASGRPDAYPVMIFTKPEK